MPDQIQPQHDGCWNCGSTDEATLASKTIYDVFQWNKREERLDNMAPYSIALCSKRECQAVTKINLSTRKAITS